MDQQLNLQQIVGLLGQLNGQVAGLVQNGTNEDQVPAMFTVPVLPPCPARVPPLPELQRPQPQEPLIAHKQEVLSVQEVVNLLSCAETHAISQRPLKPKSGSIFIIKSKDKLTSEDWRSHGYRWLSVNGIKDFTMRSYIDETKPMYALLHFIGDHKKAVDFPHKGSKSDEAPDYMRTAASTLRAAKASTQRPAQYRREKIRKAGTDQASQTLAVPKNNKQVTAAQYRFLRIQRSQTINVKA